MHLGTEHDAIAIGRSGKQRIEEAPKDREDCLRLKFAKQRIAAQKLLRKRQTLNVF